MATDESHDEALPKTAHADGRRWLYFAPLARKWGRNRPQACWRYRRDADFTAVCTCARQICTRANAADATTLGL